MTVGFDYAVFADGVSIVETRSGGFVQKVEAMDEAGNFTEVWSGVDSLTAPGELDFPGQKPSSRCTVCESPLMRID